MISNEAIIYFIFQRKTAFIPFRYLYPECLFLIREHSGLYPLRCMKDSCSANKNCAENLAKRVYYFFQHVEPSIELLIAYFKYVDKPNSIRAGVFTKDLDEPKVMTVNPYAFTKFQKESITKRWWPSPEFCGIGKSSIPTIISPDSLIK